MMITNSAYQCKGCQQELELPGTNQEIDHYCTRTLSRTKLVRVNRWARMREAVAFGAFFVQGNTRLYNMLHRAAVRCYYLGDATGGVFRPATRKHYQQCYREFKKGKETDAESKGRVAYRGGDAGGRGDGQAGA